MKHLATYANMGEAGFVQSILESEGIETGVNDPRNIIGGVQEVTLDVADDQFDRARELVAQIAASHIEEASDASDAKAPLQGYPFLGIVSVCAMLGLAVGAAEILLVDHIAVPAITYLSRILSAGIVGASAGILVGLFVSLLFLPVYFAQRRRHTKHR